LEGVKVKLLLIFLYSTATSLVWWLLFHVNAWWAWAFFVPAFAVGLALVYRAGGTGEKRSMDEILQRLAKDGRPWRWRG
jgi:hypothetical protein